MSSFEGANWFRLTKLFSCSFPPVEKMGDRAGVPNELPYLWRILKLVAHGADKEDKVAA